MTDTYEKYPWTTVLASNGISLSIAAIGTTVLAGLGWIWAVCYLMVWGWAFLKILTRSCPNCHYYGKQCGLGMGILCKVFFKPGNPAIFAKKEASWVQLLPDMLVLVMPLAGGITLLFIEFSWLILGLLAALVLIAMPGNGILRSTLLCPHCKQRELGCPAEKLFRKQTA